tara:strand:+ start:1735 stop:2613 length:879 start_codon:yes stop_codon:yes gene_type:complete
MNAFIFPGQGSQKPKMGLDLYENYSDSKIYFKKANEVLNFNITELMFEGSNEDLIKTSVTQPAIFIHSVIHSLISKKFKPDAAAGHSLGEFSALSACKAISFEDGLKLVSIRANAMQNACEKNPGGMAAILGIDNSIIENVCSNINKVIKPANYNCPGQLVISGEIDAVKIACEELTNLGAKRAIILPVSGAFHSELMSSAAEELEHSINQTDFNNPVCPIYQNYNAQPETDKESIKRNLLLQLTNPVLWSQSVNRMIKDGYKNFFELGPGNTLQGLIRKIDSEVNTEKLEI